jgi:hypothetical protein
MLQHAAQSVWPGLRVRAWYRNGYGCGRLVFQFSAADRRTILEDYEAPSWPTTEKELVADVLARLRQRICAPSPGV